MHQDGTLNEAMNNAKAVELLCQLGSQIDRLDGYVHIEPKGPEAAGLQGDESAFIVTQASEHHNIDAPADLAQSAGFPHGSGQAH